MGLGLSAHTQTGALLPATHAHSAHKDKKQIIIMIIMTIIRQQQNQKNYTKTTCLGTQNARTHAESKRASMYAHTETRALVRAKGNKNLDM